MSLWFVDMNQRVKKPRVSWCSCPCVAASAMLVSRFCPCPAPLPVASRAAGYGLVLMWSAAGGNR